MPVRRLLSACALLAACACLPARAADYTDLWYVPTESGWGVNVVQSDNFLFLTFFIYGPDNRPTWYTAQLTWDGTRYSGGLYSTQGSYWAVPWDPAAHPAATAVGTASFTPSALNAYDATLSYTVNGVATVTKAVTRQTLTAIALGGNYVGGQAGSYSGCTNTANNSSYADAYTLTVSQSTAGTATFTFNYASGAVCTLSGTLEQHGQIYRMPGATYACTGNGHTLNTTATVYEIKATAQGLEGRLAASVGGNCQENANFSGVLR